MVHAISIGSQSTLLVVVCVTRHSLIGLDVDQSGPYILLIQLGRCP